MHQNTSAGGHPQLFAVPICGSSSCSDPSASSEESSVAQPNEDRRGSLSERRFRKGKPPPVLVRPPRIEKSTVCSQTTPTDYNSPDGFLFHAKYALGETLGQGTSALVKAATPHDPCIAETRDLAVKILRTGKDPERVALYKHEFDVMQSIPSHANIVRFHEFYDNSADDGAVYILQSRVRGYSLAEYFITESANEQTCLGLLHGLLSGLAHLHKHNVVHRDIKPENLMVRAARPASLEPFHGIASLPDSARLVLLDFNCAAQEDAALTPIPGTFIFNPPEVLSGTLPRTTSQSTPCVPTAGVLTSVASAQGYPLELEGSDIWSCGLCLYFMLAGGFYPWEVDEELQLCSLQPGADLLTCRDSFVSWLCSWSRASPAFPAKYFGRVSESAKSLVRSCLRKDPALRPSARELLEAVELLILV